MSQCFHVVTGKKADKRISQNVKPFPLKHTSHFFPFEAHRATVANLLKPSLNFCGSRRGQEARNVSASSAPSQNRSRCRVWVFGKRFKGRSSNQSSAWLMFRWSSVPCHAHWHLHDELYGVFVGMCVWDRDRERGEWVSERLLTFQVPCRTDTPVPPPPHLSPLPNQRKDQSHLISEY